MQRHIIMAVTDKEVRIFTPLMAFFAIIIFLAFFSSNLRLTGKAVSLTAPTGNANIRGDFIFKASADANDNVANMSFYCNNSYFSSVLNNSPQQTDFNAFFNTSNIPDGKNYNITAIGYNSTRDEVSRSSVLGLTIDNAAPTIQYNAPTPANGANLGASENLTINVSASDSVELSSITIYVNGSTSMTCVTSNCYYTANLANGTYSFYAIANDTLGNANTSETRTIAIGNVTQVIPAVLVSFNASIVGPTGTGISANMAIFKAGTTEKVKNYSLPAGNLTNEEIINDTYDLLLSASDGSISILIKGVSIYSNSNKKIGLDKNIPAAGFNKTYAVSNTYDASSFSLLLSYNGTSFMNESYLGVYKCADWNFTGRVCSGNWSRITADMQSKTGNYFIIETVALSGFGIKQEPFCGDGICSNNENKSNCSADCGANATACEQGNITEKCLCGGIEYLSGYCCNSTYQATPCIAACGEGKITGKCSCNGVSYTSGYCCNNAYQANACQDELAKAEEQEKKKSNTTIIILVVIGILLIGGAVATIVYSSKKPKEEIAESMAPEIRLKPYQAVEQPRHAKTAEPAFTPEKVAEIIRKKQEEGEKLSEEKKKKIIEELKKLSE